MINEGASTGSLPEIVYVDFDQYALLVLEQIQLPRATIERIRQSAETGRSNYEVLGRIRILDENATDIEECAARQFKGITLRVSRDFVLGFDSVNLEEVRFKPSDIEAYHEFFKPAVLGHFAGRKPERTTSLAKLSVILINQIVISEEGSLSELGVIKFVLQLQRAGIARRFLKESAEIELPLSAKSYSAVSPEAADAEIEKNLSVLGVQPLLRMTQLREGPKLAQVAWQLLDYDYSQVTPEILGPLLLEIFPSHGKAGLWGNATSYENVHDIIGPLITDQYLMATVSNQGDGAKDSHELKSLGEIKILDPTDSPGSFLSAAISEIGTLQALSLKDGTEPNLLKIHNFAGIVSSNEVHEVSSHCVWFAFLHYLGSLGKKITTDDLLDAWVGLNIKIKPQLESDWSDVFVSGGPDFIVGAPKFVGVQKQSKEEKQQLSAIMGTEKAVDYCAGWLLKGAEYLANQGGSCAFVLTNSVCQGAQVPKIWKKIFSLGVEISFAREAFRWKNTATNNTGVTVVVVGLRRRQQDIVSALLFDKNNNPRSVNVIGPYLLPNSIEIVEPAPRPASEMLPQMLKGNMAYGEDLVLSEQDSRELVLQVPEANVLLRKLVGAEELMLSLPRRCLWIKESQIPLAQGIPAIWDRVMKVKAQRSASPDKAGRKLAATPYSFRETNETLSHTLVVPALSSENRKYIPMAFVGGDTIVSNLAFAVYDAPTWLLGLLSSELHQIWARAFSGGFETRIRYSNRGVYNTFPVVMFDEDFLEKLEDVSLQLIRMRENYCDVGLGALYNDLPHDLVALHAQLDSVVSEQYGIAAGTGHHEKLQELIRIATSSRSTNANGN